MNLISKKLHSLRDAYGKAKGDAVGVIQGRLDLNKFSLLEKQTTAQEIWIILQNKFKISVEQLKLEQLQLSS